MTPKLITVASFSSDFEAEIARGKLQSLGIDSFIFKDDCGGMRPHMLLTAGVQLKVSEQDFSEAIDILQYEVVDETQFKSSSEEAHEKVHLLLNRARGWILVGFAIVPGWISFPISYVYATKASNLRRFSKLDDPDLKNKIYRVRVASALFTLLFWTTSIYYVVEHLTNR